MNHDFRPELFTEPTEYEEAHLRDRKAKLPDLRRDDEKGEFIRDVIALANTARMFGQPAYLLYGLKDNVDEGPPVCDLGDSLALYGKPGTQRIWESLKRSIGQAVAEYIEPQVMWELVHGQVSEQEVAYLLIHPIASDTVFYTRKKIKNEFEPNQSWIRFGESKRDIRREKISPNDDRYRYAYASVPFVLPSTWRNYFTGILNERNPLENLNAAQDIRGYQDLHVIDGRSLQEVVKDFLSSEKTLLIIEGAAGSGKSAFVRRWVAEQTEAQLQAIEEKIKREEFSPPSAGWIPVYHRLRNEPIRANYCLANRLLDAVNKKSGGSFWKGRRRPERVDELFQKTELHWVICLDGLDEISSQQKQKTFLEALRGFLETYPGVKVILTTRPDTGVDTLKAIGELVTIAPLKDEQIMLYLQNWADAEDYDEFVGALCSNPELWELCRTPAYLEAACQRLSGKPLTPLEPMVPPATSVEAGQQMTDERPTPVTLITIPKADEELLILSAPLTSTEEPQVEILSDENRDKNRPLKIGEVLHEIYTYLWDREGSRCANFRKQKAGIWWEKTGLLAIQMDGRHSNIRATDAQQKLGSDGLHHVLSLGVLRCTNSLICFNAELTKAYFAATWLRDCLETNDMRKARHLLIQAAAEFRCQVRDLLEPLTAKNTQPLFQEVTDESVPG